MPKLGFGDQERFKRGIDITLWTFLGYCFRVARFEEVFS